MPKISDLDWLEKSLTASSKLPGLRGINSLQALVELQSFRALNGPEMTIVDFLRSYAEDAADATPKRFKKALCLIKQPTH